MNIKVNKKWFRSLYNDTDEQKDIQGAMAIAVLFGRDSQEYKNYQNYLKNKYNKEIL